MIIQKLASAIRRQDWFQVVIEIFIVVIGIYLGLQVSDWAEDQKERAEEIEYLARLHDDIVDSMVENNTRIEFMNRQDNYAQTMLDDLSNCHLPSENEFIFTNGLNIIGKILPAVFYRTTLDELNSTGKSLVIQNIELRKALSKHSVLIDEAVDIDNKLLLRTIPHVVEIDKKFTFNIQRTRLGDADIKVGEIIYNFETLCNDQDFSHSISLLKAYAYDELARVLLAIEQQQDLKAMIEAEMDKFQ